MNKPGIVVMNKKIKTIASVMVAFSMVVAAVAVSTTATVATAFDLGETPDYFTDGTADTNQSGQVVTESNSTFTECALEASRNLVTIGESINLNWYTSGFSNITINGQSVSSNTGSMVISNLQNSTTFTLQALNNNGASCTQQVLVTCIPPEEPKECELVLEKSVDKTAAVPGNELTYTITIKNIGEARCTGSDVKIEDVVDQNLTYLRHSLSNNLNAGYGNLPVYTSTDHTLHFDGNILEPNESGTITWVGQVKTPTQCGDFEVKNQAKATAAELNNFQTWAYSQTVKTAIDNDCPVPVTPVCTLVPSTETIGQGGVATLTWTTEHATTVTLTDFGSVVLDGATTTVPLYANKTYTLLATGPGGQVTCTSQIVVTQESPAPTCDSFTANPATIVVGASTTLAWNTSNASQIFINNGIGAVSADGSITVAPLANITYQLTAIGVENKTVTCNVPVTVTQNSVPVCELFTATPNALPVGGGTVALNWRIIGANSASILPLVGTVSLIGSQSVTVIEDTTFTLTATDATGDTVSCTAPVTVADPEPVLTCANSVSFTASDSSIDRGDDTTLTWSTTNVDTVSISSINATSLSGSQSVSPTDDSTYVLTATRGTQSVSCPLSIDVSSGSSGGGGSVSPRCELTISDKQISSGDKVELEWDTTNATEVTLTDDRGKILFTTDDYLSEDKKKYYDHELTVKPTRDTTYTLLAERGSRDVDCSVKVKVGDGVVVLETRDQQPLVAGISLSQVPYTGFEAGPFMTALFYLLLVIWSLYITYLLVVRKQTMVGMSNSEHIVVTHGETLMQNAEVVRPDLFTKTSVPTKTCTVNAPENLPTGPIVIGYENLVEGVDRLPEPVVAINPHQVNDVTVTDLENRAHAQKALLSSDAVRHFVSTTDGLVNRHEHLDDVISEAKKTYPLEDGWVVINESRMRNLCEVCKKQQVVSSTEPFIPATVPEGSGSLAEAIVTGNIVAAYQMIGNRPMFALADAAADLDAVYRNRRGGKATVSDLLTSETKRLSDVQLKNAITALTGALDGTYTSEEQAVKVSIMKAVKAVA